MTREEVQTIRERSEAIQKMCIDEEIRKGDFLFIDHRLPRKGDTDKHFLDETGWDLSDEEMQFVKEGLQMLVVAFTLASCSSVVYYFMKPLPGAVVTMLAIISMSIDSTPLWTVAMFIVAMLEMYLMIYWMLPPLLPALKEMEFFRREESKSEG